MFNITLTQGPKIDVAYRNSQFSYAIDGSIPNPLEAAYAAIAACAGVFAKKACMGLGISDEGIEISVKPMPSKNPMRPAGFATAIHFPAHFTAEQKAAVLASVETCPVKELIKHGAEVNFVLTEV